MGKPVTSAINNGTRYQISGPAHADTLIFIHGLGLNRQIWADYITAFEQDYRVISYDLFGHGESAAPPRKPDLSVYAKQVVSLIDELDIDRAALIGFSLGGMINRRVAMDYPDHVSALVILNSPHERTPEAQRLVEERASDTTAGGITATLDATIQRWFTESFRQQNPGYIQQVRDWVLANNPADYADCRRVLATGVIELINPQPPIMHPTLVMTCENDSGSTPVMSHGIAGEIENADTIIVPCLQHMGLVEKPEVFIDPVTRFLKFALS
ncbi:MAG: alpha/beta fold hydrolase [Gammaproteobacteria bacterium]|nr:alpha/beta fold hydrolase [Gammaproteobacteria bacterium]